MLEYHGYSQSQKTDGASGTLNLYGFCVIIAVFLAFFSFDSDRGDEIDDEWGGVEPRFGEGRNEK